MGWSLNSRDPYLSREASRLLLCLGKALYLASEFESKCRFILRVANLVDLIKTTEDSSAIRELSKAIKDKMLGPTIKNLRKISDFKQSELDILDKAKDARNKIAHEIGSIGPIFMLKDSLIEKKFEELALAVKDLIDGDNVVSAWVYEIEEKEVSPKHLSEEYLNNIMVWLFANEDDEEI